MNHSITQAWGPRDRANGSVQGEIPSQRTLLLATAPSVCFPWHHWFFFQGTAVLLKMEKSGIMSESKRKDTYNDVVNTNVTN